MFKFRSDIVFRFNLVVILVFLSLAFVIIGSASVTMFKEREIWNKIKDRYVQDNISITPERGRILDERGEPIISSLPYYRLRIDFKYVNKDNQRDVEETRRKREELWTEHLDEVSKGLSEIFPGETAESFKKRLKEGLDKEERYFRLYKGKVSYTQYNRLMELPVFKEGKKYSGLFFERDEDFVKNPNKNGVQNRVKTDRKNIFGDVGQSTFGIYRESMDDGKQIMDMNGLEKKYNEYLCGKPGIGRRETNRKGKSITKIKQAAVDGMDVQTTINTEMLDICHTALERELRAKTLAAGWAILMETKTGDIKAIVNLSREVKEDGTVVYVDTSDKLKSGYNETPNHALCDLNEPGSIFKTVALTAILADGKLTAKDSVKAYESKVCNINGHKLHDEMYRNNGTGKYSMSDAMMYSSNISLVQFIRKAYKDNPEEYTNTLKRFGITENYRLIDNESTPSFPEPGNKGDNKLRWDKYTLHSLSMGYAINMTAINMVSFYNTIANGGKQMKPRLVKAILDKGKVVKEFPTTVINKQLFSKSVADEVTEMLVKVVNGKSIIADRKDWRYGKRDGTGKNAYSEMMTIAGKTGTAISRKKKNDKLMSFCGFFPAEKPEYTLIVQIMYDYELDPRPTSEKEKTKYGGGSTSAHVFKEIAEKVMTKKMRRSVEEVKDCAENFLPEIKSGNRKDIEIILSEMGISYTKDNAEKDSWGSMKRLEESKGYEYETQETDIYKIPDLEGMGAKDAVYLLHRRKMKVLLEGYGKVVRQSIPKGSDAIEGETITLTLEP